MTGQDASRSTLSATLPRKSRRNPVLPWVPITMASALYVLDGMKDFVVRHTLSSFSSSFEAGRVRALLRRRNQPSRLGLSVGQQQIDGGAWRRGAADHDWVDDGAEH